MSDYHLEDGAGWCLHHAAAGGHDDRDGLIAGALADACPKHMVGHLQPTTLVQILAGCSTIFGISLYIAAFAM